MTWDDNIWIEGLQDVEIPSEGGTFSFLIYNDSDEDAVIYISNVGALQVFINSSYSVPKNSFTVAHYTVQPNETNQLRNFSFSFGFQANSTEETISFNQLGVVGNNNIADFENIKYYPGISTYAPAGNIGNTGAAAADFLTDNINEKNIFEKFPISETNGREYTPPPSIYNMSKLLAQYTIYKVDKNLSPISFELQTQLTSGTYMFVDKVTNESIIVRF